MPHPLDDVRIERARLTKYNFDASGIRREVDQILAGTKTPASAIIRRKIEPAPAPLAVTFDDDASRAVRSVGEEALRQGHVAIVVLNGGMATRFGGVVKGVVEVYDGKSFLALKAEDARRAAHRYGASVPLVLMNSFATHDATLDHVRATDGLGLPADDLSWFLQSISVRLNPDGTLFVGDDGAPSYHAPGHGDFFASIRSSGVLERLRDRGVKYILFSNVDNLGATVDPVVLGHHIRSGCAMSAEVTQKKKNAKGQWDKGGAPALVDGQLQLVEGFRFPPELAQEILPDFSTNNFIFDAAAIDLPLPLERHVVSKTVDGRAALQLESIACEASALTNDEGAPLLPLLLLRVPREGPFGRFFPVKEPEDLQSGRAAIRERLAAGWRLRDEV